MMITISTSGIGPMDITSSTKAKGSSKEEEKAVEAFASLMNMVSARQDNSNSVSTSEVDVTEVAPNKDVSKEYESYSKPEKVDEDNNKLQNTDKTETTKDTETSEVKETDTGVADDKETIDKAVALIKEVKETLKEALGITEEQLENILADMGIDASQLLLGDNLKNFILQAQGASNVDLLVNEKLVDLVTDISDKVANLIEEFGFADDFDFQSLINDNAEIINGMLQESVENDDIIIDDVVDNHGELKSAKDTTTKMSDDTKVVEENLDDNAKSDVKQFDNQGDANMGDGTIDEKIAVKASGDNGQAMNQDQTPEQTSQQIQTNFNQAIDNAVNTNIDVASFTGNVQEADIIRQIIDQIKINVGREIQSMEVQLNPENLGKVYVNVEAKDGVMQAKIIAETEAAKNAIENNLAILKEDFSNNEIKVEAIEVMVAAYGFFEESKNQDFDNQEQANDTSKTIGGVNINNLNEEELTEEETLEVEIMKTQGNTVSYTV